MTPIAVTTRLPDPIHTPREQQTRVLYWVRATEDTDAGWLTGRQSNWWFMHHATHWVPLPKAPDA